jgi:hypothetical protein
MLFDILKLYLNKSFLIDETIFSNSIEAQKVKEDINYAIAKNGYSPQWHIHSL